MSMSSEVSQEEEFHTVDEILKSMQQFGWFDYSIFIAMVACCSIIGIYFAWKSKKQQQINRNRRTTIELEYTLGGRRMNVFPVSMSLIASIVSATHFLGISTETYLYGSTFMIIYIGRVLGGLILHYVFLPVFLDLKLTSIYEYLETRFDKRTRLFAAVLFSIGALLQMPVMMYITALAFNQIAGVNIYTMTSITCAICVFYTSIGGFKAVVWTDTIQIFVMYGAMLSVTIKGLIDVGLKTTIERNVLSGRYETPPVTFDFTERHSLLAIIVGGTLYYMPLLTVQQGTMQRYLSLPNLTAARKALWIYTVGGVIMMLLGCFNGTIIYAAYHDCDPITTKLVKAKDQLLSLYVMEIFHNIPGLTGMFIAGVFSATLSTLSTLLNSLSTVFYEDFVKPFRRKRLSEQSVNNILRGVVIIYGLVSIALGLIVGKLGTIVQLSMSIIAITNGPLFAIFLIGLIIPWINGKSALIGGCFGSIFMSWMVVKTQLLAASGVITYKHKSLSVEGCAYNFTMPTIETIAGSIDQEKTFYHMSYLWYTLVGTIFTSVVAFLSSFIFGWNKPENINLSVLAPFVRKYFTNNHKSDNDNGDVKLSDGIEEEEAKLFKEAI